MAATVTSPIFRGTYPVPLDKAKNCGRLRRYLGAMVLCSLSTPLMTEKSSSLLSSSLHFLPQHLLPRTWRKHQKYGHMAISLLSDYYRVPRDRRGLDDARRDHAGECHLNRHFPPPISPVRRYVVIWMLMVWIMIMAGPMMLFRQKRLTTHKHAC